MNLIVFEKFAVISINILGIFLGFSVFFANKKSRQHILYLATSLIMLLWIDSSFLSNLLKSEKYLLMAGKANLSFFVLFSVVIFLFIKNFPRDLAKFSIKSICVAIIGIGIASVTFFSKIVVNRINFVNGDTKWFFGPGEWFLYAFSIFIALIISITLYKKYAQSDKIDRIKIRYFLISAIVFALLNLIFNLVIPAVYGIDDYYFIGDYSIIIMLILISIAITRDKLFNIKVIATESTVILISIVLLVQTLSANNLSQGMVQGIIWVLATYGGYVLIKSVKVEIKQKEDLQVLTKKLDEANAHLEELDAAKDNFLSMAAHELNTPIAAIEGYLSMIIDEKMAGELNEKLAGYLKNIYGSSKRLANLVRNLLNVSRIESNRIHLLYAETQTEDIIDQAIAEVKIKADEVGHKLTFEKPKPALPKTWFDVDRITEVVINMIGNAIKYTDPPGIINVSAHTDGDKIVVAIKDNGRGIPKDKEDHIFEKFSQVNVMKDQVKGTGLGMFIVKNLVELHHGKVWFKSSVDEKDHGTTFYFSIPILKEKPEDPHEGEGALFQTGQKAPAPASQPKAPVQERTLNQADKPAGSGQAADVTDDEKGADNKTHDQKATEKLVEAEKDSEEDNKPEADIKLENKTIDKK